MIFDPTSVDWIYVTVGAVILYLTYWIHFIPKKLNAPHWVVRKSLHTPTTIIVAFLPYFTENLFNFVLASIGLLLLIIISALIPQIKLIQHIFESGLRKEEKTITLALNNAFSIGSVFLILFIFPNDLHIYTSAVLAMSVGDALGEIIGKPFGKIKYKLFHEKSLEGSLAVFIGIFICIVISFAINDLLSYEIIWKLVLTSLIGTIFEALNYKGLDNTTVPLSVAFSLYLFFI